MVWHSVNVRESERERRSESMNKPCPKVVSLGCCVGMSAPLRKNMAVSGALSVIRHVRAARWLLYVSSPRVSDIIWYAYRGEINNFPVVYFVLKWLWIALEQAYPFLQRAHGSSWLEWQYFSFFKAGLVLNAPDVKAGNIIFFILKWHANPPRWIVYFASALRQSWPEKILFDFLKAAWFSSLLQWHKYHSVPTKLTDRWSIADVVIENTERGWTINLSFSLCFKFPWRNTSKCR